MNNFQNYYPQIPNMNQIVQQTVNPYLERVQQYQQMFNQQQNMLSGRIVEDFATVGANDVPMDGRFATFIKPDLSEIEVRQWQSNGTIGKISFKPIIEVEAKEVPVYDSKAEFEAITKLLEGISERLNALEVSAKPTRARKEKENASE